MSVNFQSAERRRFWTGLAFSLGVDYFIALLILAALGAGSYSLIAALALVLAVHVFLSAYSLLGFLQGIVWYHAFEKTGRVLALEAEFRRFKFPSPKAHYNDADEYLTTAALSKEVSDDGRLMAGMMLGALASQRTFGPRTQAIISNMAIESAIQRLPPVADEFDYAQEAQGYNAEE